MTVQELWEQVCMLIDDESSKFSVVTAINFNDPENEQQVPITVAVWDAANKRLVLVQE